MPQVFKIGNYVVYFWVNESVPLEPIHVHIAEGVPSPTGTKIWLTKTGSALLAHNASKIPNRQLHIMMEIIAARHKDIEALWKSKFGEIRYYC